MSSGRQPDGLRGQYQRTREASLRLAAPLSPEDCTIQSMPDASPTKWHLAHTSWYFETFVLESGSLDYRPFDPHYRVLFNSYYNSVGDQYSRPDRGLLSRPPLEEVLAYRAHVDAAMGAVLEKEAGLEADVRDVVELGVHHEQQHQELILTDLKHMLSRNPMHPAYREYSRERPAPERCEAAPLRWFHHGGDLVEIGHAGAGFAFDNEGPRHRVVLEDFALASRPVTCGEYQAFIEAGGYRDPAHWLADGWATVQERGWRAPLYWQQGDDGWRQQTLAGLRPVLPEEPVCHVSYYEADAYARWAGARLPGEAEWEHAATGREIAGNFVESDALHPRPAPADAEAGPVQLFGDVWEWTRSPYVPYPGYQPPPGAIGEYNGKFMSNQLVLRGGSCATPRSHIRASYRNFFYPDQRWQFSGIRLARDA